MLIHNKSIDSSNSRLNRTEWGLETGVEGKQNSRLVLLSELHNYRRLTHRGFIFYISIIDTKHPKYVRTTDKGIERWRMRFNVFSSGFFAQWRPNTVLHLGELHVYYDLIADRSKPWCDDFTFYFDLRDIGVEIIPYRYQQMEWAFKDSLVGEMQLMRFLLYLPIERTSFFSPNKVLDDFLERQDVILSQLEQLKGDSHRCVTFRDAIKGGVTYVKLQSFIDTQRKRPPYQRNTYQRPING